MTVNLRNILGLLWFYFSFSQVVLSVTAAAVLDERTNGEDGVLLQNDHKNIVNLKWVAQQKHQDNRSLFLRKKNISQKAVAVIDNKSHSTASNNKIRKNNDSKLQQHQRQLGVVDQTFDISFYYGVLPISNVPQQEDIDELKDATEIWMSNALSSHFSNLDSVQVTILNIYTNFTAVFPVEVDMSVTAGFDDAASIPSPTEIRQQFSGPKLDEYVHTTLWSLSDTNPLWNTWGVIQAAGQQGQQNIDPANLPAVTIPTQPPPGQRMMVNNNFVFGFPVSVAPGTGPTGNDLNIFKTRFSAYLNNLFTNAFASSSTFQSTSVQIDVPAVSYSTNQVIDGFSYDTVVISGVTLVHQFDPNLYVPSVSEMYGVITSTHRVLETFVHDNFWYHADTNPSDYWYQVYYFGWTN